MCGCTLMYKCGYLQENNLKKVAWKINPELECSIAILLPQQMDLT